MKTELRSRNYQEWFLENLQYRDRLLTLTVEEMLSKEDQLREPQRFLVIFPFTVMYQIYDECDHRNDFHENRQKGVLAKYNTSRLLEHVKSDTIIFDTVVGILEHWSLMTTNEFVHVITNQPPKVVNVT
jgi:hypothetical protein